MCIWYSPLAAMRHTYFWKAPGPLCRQVTPAIAEQRKVQSTTTLEIVGKKPTDPTVCSTSKLGETHLQKAMLDIPGALTIPLKKGPERQDLVGG